MTRARARAKIRAKVWAKIRAKDWVRARATVARKQYISFLQRNKASRGIIRCTLHLPYTCTGVCFRFAPTTCEQTTTKLRPTRDSCNQSTRSCKPKVLRAEQHQTCVYSITRILPLNVHTSASTRKTSAAELNNLCQAFQIQSRLTQDQPQASTHCLNPRPSVRHSQTIEPQARRALSSNQDYDSNAFEGRPSR